MRPRPNWCLPVIACILLQSTSFAQFDDEDEDFLPGLHAVYSAGERTIDRIDADVAFVWGRDAPDARLPAGPFQATWEGRVLVRQEGKYRLHVMVQGNVTVTLDGTQILDAQAQQPQWKSSRPLGLTFGEKLLRIEYSRPEASGRLQVFWSSDKFPLEPLPAHLLYRDERLADAQIYERGVAAFAAHRCNRCHVRADDPPAPAAPALTSLGEGTDPASIIAKLRGAAPIEAHANMPQFGFDEGEAAAIAAYLQAHAKSVPLSVPKPPSKEKDRQQEARNGELLLRTTGCLACHRVGDLGQDGPFGGGDLSDIGNKRSLEWLATWLHKPQSLNPDHRMPIFKLSNSERRQLAVALSRLKGRGEQSKDSQDAEPDKQLVEQGRKLIEASHCATCHRIPGIDTPRHNFADLSKPVANWEKSCLADKPDRAAGRPAYPHVDRAALRAFVEARVGALSPESTFAQGQRVLRERNCLACHDRDLSKGLRGLALQIANAEPDLKGRTQTLVPPALTAVGDKLHDAALREAVAGKQPVRMTWLTARMPAFDHSPEDLEALTAYLIGHDRIPDGAPHTIADRAVIPSALDDSQVLVAGHTLVGPKGFSCIACHKIGEYEPRQVALGTRGSDLLMLGSRMRESFFLRWTRAPLRIVPGMEMPSYDKPVPNLAEGNVDAQLAVMWKSLNDPRFKPPTNPSVVEQYFVVKSGEPARIVRDVFTNPEENGGGYTARALAIGLNNGHNVLFDLDRFTLSQWTFGDLARQRTAGKSWYWDMAGVPVVAGFKNTSDFALLAQGQPTTARILPYAQGGSSGKLHGYNRHADGLQFSYSVNFQIKENVRQLEISEIVEPLSPSSKGGGWARKIDVRGIPAGYRLLVFRPVGTSTLGNPQVEAILPAELNWQTLSDGESREQCVALASDRGQIAATFHYTCELQHTELELQLQPPVPPSRVPVHSVPGFEGAQLPLPESIMPTALAWQDDGTLAFASLKGDVFLARDTDGNGEEDTLALVDEGLAAPYGLIADGPSLIVAHKPELLRLYDHDGDSRADERTVVATGWGYNDNYHDWTTGIVRDESGNLFIGLGSDYAQPERPREQSLWRGKVLKVAPDGRITPFAHSFRYPTGLAFDNEGRLFCTDNQGVQNTFNELNHLVMGRHYGVPSHFEEEPDAQAFDPAVKIPHPWTRSINGIFFFPRDYPVKALAGHGIGCEYNEKLLIRFTLQEVDGELQGATYYFSKPDVPDDQQAHNFLGPICGGTSPEGEIYIGSIHDSGWLGGRNTGSIVRLVPDDTMPNGIHELRATPDGFSIEFFGTIDPQRAADTNNYTISGYTREWGGSYATPDSGRHRVVVERVEVAPEGSRVTLQVGRLKPGYVYEITCGEIGRKEQRKLWPATGHYTMNRIPKH